MKRSVNRGTASAEATRQALLDAGMRILLDHPASRTFSHLTANRVAAEAGRTTGALFHQWPTLDDYLRDLIAHIFDPSQSTTFPVIAATIAELLEKTGSLHDAIIGGAEAALGVSPEDPHSITELLMWNRAARDETFRQTVAPLYDPLDEMGAQFIELLLETTGREIRPPFTPAVFAAVCAGILQGITIREVMTPGFYPRDMLGWIFVSVTPLFTRIPGDSQTAPMHVAATRLLPEDR